MTKISFIILHFPKTWEILKHLLNQKLSKNP